MRHHLHDESVAVPTSPPPATKRRTAAATDIIASSSSQPQQQQHASLSSSSSKAAATISYKRRRRRQQQFIFFLVSVIMFLSVNKLSPLHNEDLLPSVSSTTKSNNGQNDDGTPPSTLSQGIVAASSYSAFNNLTVIATQEEHQDDNDKRITIIIMTYKRAKYLQQSKVLSELVPLPIVKELVIVWNDVGNTTGLDSLQSKFVDLNIHDKTRFYFPTINSINNRFMVPDVTTQCIYQIDDEWYMTKPNFQLGYQLWLNNPMKLIGQLPRKIKYEYNETDGSEKAYYISKGYDSFNYNRLIGSIHKYGYNVLLPGGGIFFHKLYMDLYSNVSDNNIIRARNFINNITNCEDLLLNFLVPSHYHPPILYCSQEDKQFSIDYLRVILKENPNGLSVGGNKQLHLKKRRSCIKEFSKLFDGEFDSKFGKKSYKIWSSPST